METGRTDKLQVSVFYQRVEGGYGYAVVMLPPVEGVFRGWRWRRGVRIGTSTLSEEELVVHYRQPVALSDDGYEIGNNVPVSAGEHPNAPTCNEPRVLLFLTISAGGNVTIDAREVLRWLIGEGRGGLCDKIIQMAEDAPWRVLQTLEVDSLLTEQVGKRLAIFS
jgi:hypothetical protein